MVRKKEEMVLDSKCLRNGIGETAMRKILNGVDEMYGKGRMFNVMTLAPGNTIGEHAHTGDNEIFYIISGTGEYCDNGTWVTLTAGDAAICSDGNSHAMKNLSDEPLEFIALILY